MNGQLPNIDLAPIYSASLSALMNTMGSLGGVVSSTVTAALAVHQPIISMFGSFPPSPLVVCASKVYPVDGSRHCDGIITLIDPQKVEQIAQVWENSLLSSDAACVPPKD